MAWLAGVVGTGWSTRAWTRWPGCRWLVFGTGWSTRDWTCWPDCRWLVRIGLQEPGRVEPGGGGDQPRPLDLPG